MILHTAGEKMYLAGSTESIQRRPRLARLQKKELANLMNTRADTAVSPSTKRKLFVFANMREVEANYVAPRLRYTSSNIACGSLQAIQACTLAEPNRWGPHVCCCRSKLTWKSHDSAPCWMWLKYLSSRKADRWDWFFPLHPCSLNKNLKSSLRYWSYTD